ncbi:ricin-type beta-trefoil lectin domain protein [Jatrophihabitans sp. DSM 45814]
MDRQLAHRTLCLIVATLVVVVSVAASTVGAPASADETTVSYDSMRTGWDPNEPGLAPAAVSSSDFGSVFTTVLPRPAGATANQVYAQPLLAGGTLVVATEENQLHGLDPTTGAVRWTVTLGPAWPAATSGCGDLTPDIGITSTPVYDAASNTIYASGKVNDGPDVHHPRWRLAAIDATTGVMRPGWPVTIAGAPDNDPFRPFDPAQAGQRAGLLLMGGRVYLGFASHCSYLPYVGYVASVETTSRQVHIWTTEAGSTNSGGGVWQSGGGLVSDGPGRVIFATGNGFSAASPGVGPGGSPPTKFAESVVRLSVAADGTMTPKDFFSPVNNPQLDRNDTDLGSGGPAALPASFGTPSHPHLLIQVGKDGRVFLLDRDNLGGTGQGPAGTDAALSVVQLKGVWGHPAVWPGSGGYVYIVETNGNLRALRVNANGSGVPTLSVAGTSAETFGYTSGSPVVTSSGSSAGSALVWVVQSSGATGTGGRLLAYDAVPVGGALHLRYAAPVGTVAKFVVPATDSGRVYVATRDGRVLGFGRPAASVISAPPVGFGNVAVGKTATATATLTAHTAVHITGLATNPPFAVGAGAPQLPLDLIAGQILKVPLSFTPAVADAANGLLSIATAAVGSVEVDVHGVGTAPGLAADPGAISFGQVAIGSAVQAGVSLRNTGTTPVEVLNTSTPAAPFSLAGLPPNHTVIAAGAAITFTATVQPTSAGSFAATTTIFWQGGGKLSIALSATAVSGVAHLSLAPASLDFGQVPIGQSRSLTFDIGNTGTVALTLSKAAPPAAPFTVSTPVAEGTTLQPGEVIEQTVTFAPTSQLAAEGNYAITADDGSGGQQVAISANTTPPIGNIHNGVLCLGSAGGTAVLETCSTATSQQFWIPGDGTLARAGGDCLQATAIAVGSKVGFAACQNIGYQKWAWLADQTLQNRKSGLCLAAPTDPVPGNKLSLHTCTAYGSQRFDLGPLMHSRGQAVGNGGLCIDARGGSARAGTAVQTYTCNLTPAQFVTVPTGTGTLQILGSCLGVMGAPAPASPVALATCTGLADQQWAAQAGGAVINPASGLCLDVPRASLTPGTGLQVYACNSTPAQRWTLPQ